MTTVSFNIDRFEDKVVVLIGYESSDLRTIMIPGLSDVINCAIDPERIVHLFPMFGVAWEGSTWPTRELNEFFALADCLLLNQCGDAE